MTTTTTNQEDYYILDIRNSDDSSRMDAEYVVETGIILATFSRTCLLLLDVAFAHMF